MRLKDVKLGEHYCYWSGEWIAEGIQPVDKAQGIYWTAVICRSPKTGVVRNIPARYLTPWQEHLLAQQMQDIEIQEVAVKVEQLLETIGQGASTPGLVESCWVTIRFTEQAAERLLELCDAKPIPEKDRPSAVRKTDADEYMLRCTKLSRRLRRALGVGYAGNYRGAKLARDGGFYQAEINLYGEEVDEALSKLGVEAAQEAPSALSEILG